MKGVCGRLLEIDLSSGKTKDHAVSDDMVAKYMGGRGLGARLLFDMLPPETHPLSPNSRSWVMTG
jgi:aldehyde:ferredoxin oxidoreductase